MYFEFLRHGDIMKKATGHTLLCKDVNERPKAMYAHFMVIALLKDDLYIKSYHYSNIYNI